MLRKLIGILLALLLAGGGIAYYLWNKPHRTAEGEKPVATLTADEIMAEYTSNGPASDAKYLEKVVQVSGEISAVDITENQRTRISLKTNMTDDLGIPANVTFIMKENEATESAKSGTKVVLKGICTGYNTDVQFKESVLVK